MNSLDFGFVHFDNFIVLFQLADKKRHILEAIKEYAKETQSIEKTVALIERMQGKEKELTSGTK